MSLPLYGETVTIFIHYTSSRMQGKEHNQLKIKKNVKETLRQTDTIGNSSRRSCFQCYCAPLKLCPSRFVDWTVIAVYFYYSTHSVGYVLQYAIA